jgi:CO/xanthine dehydrogenase Mo-binding subunit
MDQSRSGECPGMFALEVAMDELATAGGLDH